MFILEINEFNKFWYLYEIEQEEIISIQDKNDEHTHKFMEIKTLVAQSPTIWEMRDSKELSFDKFVAWMVRFVNERKFQHNGQTVCFSRSGIIIDFIPPELDTNKYIKPYFCPNCEMYLGGLSGTDNLPWWKKFFGKLRWK